MKPTVKTDTDGTKSWWLNGELHREDGPAAEYANGDKAWYLNGELHREDGPAIERANGDKAWWLNGKQYTEKEYWVQLIRSGLVKRDNPKVLNALI